MILQACLLQPVNLLNVQGSCPWLPDAVWTRIVQASGDTMERALIAAQLACVSKRLRALLVGPNTAPLWQKAAISSAGYQGYTKSQANGLHRTLAARGHWISSLSVNDNWEDSKLLALVHSMPNLQQVKCRGYVTAGLLAALPRHLANLNISGLLSLHAIDFPPDLQVLMLTSLSSSAERQSVTSAFLAKMQYAAACRQQLAAVAALRSLTFLQLAFSYWRWKERDLQPLLALPSLGKLIMCIPTDREHSISSVVVPSTCELSIIVTPGPHLTHLLQQLPSLRLNALNVTAPAFSTQDELALAACCVTRELGLNCQDAAWRMQHGPLCAECVVKYGLYTYPGLC